jgi:hypothetical protein
MDNCSGQNKNKYVLRLACLLVELKYYRTVYIIFLVAGHMKNAADRLFHLLKTQYRKRQVFAMEQLEAILNKTSTYNVIKLARKISMTTDISRTKSTRQPC